MDFEEFVRAYARRDDLPGKGMVDIETTGNPGLPDDAGCSERSNFWESWYESANFTTDWSTRAFPMWTGLLAELVNKPVNVLEIGCWEGRATIFFLNYLKRSSITCLDLFMFGNDGLFDANVDRYRGRVQKIKSRSGPALDRLATIEKRSFDLIYLDGSHDRDDVIVDTVLAWRLLKVGGTLIWDDYKLVESFTDFTRDQNPRLAIDTFLAWHEGEFEITHSGYQLAVRKTKPHFQAEATLMNPDAD